MTTQTSVPTKVTVIPRTYIYALVPAAVALNIVGSYINGLLNLPTFLDMIGTAVVAMTVGPWWGALAGAATNLINGFISGPIGIPFAACNVVGALVWGYGVRWGMGKSFIRYFILSILTAFFVTLMAVPIYVFIFGGATGHFADVMTAAFCIHGTNRLGSDCFATSCTHDLEWNVLVEDVLIENIHTDEIIHSDLDRADHMLNHITTIIDLANDLICLV